MIRLGCIYCLEPYVSGTQLARHLGLAVRFSGECPGPHESTAGRLSRPDDSSGHLGVQDRPHVSTTVVSTALAAGLCIRDPDLPLPWRGVKARAIIHPRRNLPGSIRWRELHCTAAHLPSGSKSGGGGPQLLALRRLSPREPPVPVAYALAQLGLLNTELFTGDLRVRGHITVMLRVSSCRIHDGLLIRAVSADGAVTGVVLMILPSHSHRATPQPRPSDP